MSTESCGQEATSSAMPATTAAPSVSPILHWHGDRKQGWKRHGKKSSLRKIPRRSASLPSESKRRISSHHSNYTQLYRRSEASLASFRKQIQQLVKKEQYYLRIQRLSLPLYTPLPYISPFTGVHHHGGLQRTSLQPPGKVADTTNFPHYRLVSSEPLPSSPVLGPDEESCNTEPPPKAFGLNTQMPVSGNTSLSTSLWVHPGGPEGQKSHSYAKGKVRVSYTTIPSLKDTSDAPSSNITLSNSAQEASKQSSSPKLQSSLFQSCEGPEEQSAEVFTPQDRNATDDSSLPFHTPTSTSDVATSSVTGPPCPENSRGSLMDSSVSTAEETLIDLSRFDFSELKSLLGDNHDTPEEKVPPITASPPSATDTVPASFLLPSQRSGESSALPHYRNMPSQSETPSTRNRKHTQRKRSQSLPDIMLHDSFERFTPEISDDGNSEIYRFQCTSPGLYQCSVTGLVFNMEGEGDVTYRIVHWDQRLLAQHHKKPAGPLFDIRCQQQSVCQLHLPHCEIRSTGACHFLSVAHVTDEGTDFILPHEITETHVVINITGFSAYGNVKDEDSPPDPIRAVVLLFYTPPADPDPTSFLYVLLLPRNVVISDVQYQRKKRNADEMYIEKPPHCKLQPNQEYTLSMSPEDESVLVEPPNAEFDNEINKNYFPHFEVTLEQILRNIHLFLTDSNSSFCVWKGRVGLPSAAIRKPQSQRVVSLCLLSIRSRFISGVSGPNLQSLLDRLLEKRVINDSEREAAHGMQNRADKARFVIDTVRNKGEAAGSEMITLLWDIDPFFCRHLGMRNNEDDET